MPSNHPQLYKSGLELQGHMVSIQSQEVFVQVKSGCSVKETVADVPYIVFPVGRQLGLTRSFNFCNSIDSHPIHQQSMGLPTGLPGETPTPQAKLLGKSSIFIGSLDFMYLAVL